MKRFTLQILLAIITLGCERTEMRPVQDVKVIGHGGNGFQMFTNPYPSNTLTSIRRALEGIGADGVEVDVQLSADNIPVLYHDNQLESQTSGTGCIPEQTWEELSSVKYRRDFGVEIFSDEKLITLEDVMKLYEGYSPRPELYLDLRLENVCGSHPDQQVFMEVLLSLIEKYKARDWVIIESGNKEFLEKIAGMGNFRLGFDCSDPGAEIEWLKLNRIESVVCGEKEVDRAISEELKAEGIQTILFNVKTQSSVKAAIGKSPYAVQADNLELMQEYLR